MMLYHPQQLLRLEACRRNHGALQLYKRHIASNMLNWRKADHSDVGLTHVSCAAGQR